MVEEWDIMERPWDAVAIYEAYWRHLNASRTRMKGVLISEAT